MFHERYNLNSNGLITLAEELITIGVEAYERQDALKGNKNAKEKDSVDRKTERRILTNHGIGFSDPCA